MIRVDKLGVRFEARVILEEVSFEVQAGEIFGILGGSGSGKTTILKHLIMLYPIQQGNIDVLGYSLKNLSRAKTREYKKKFGMLFQFGALYSTLSVLENVMLPLKEYTTLPLDIIEDIARIKLSLSGLDERVYGLYPSALSGGMKKRVALARALAIEPKLLYFDEPTSGLDPKSAEAFNALVLELRELLELTFVMVTHDVTTIKDVLDRMVFIKEGRAGFIGDVEGLRTSRLFEGLL